MPRLAALSSLAAGLLLVACQSSAERLVAIETLEDTWLTEIPEDSLAEMTENIRGLAGLKPDSPDAMISLPLLLRQAHGSMSFLVRTESLRASWALAREIPVEAFEFTEVAAAEFNEWMDRFEVLDGDPSQRDGDEMLELARRLGLHRFPPHQARFAVKLSGLVVVRGLQRSESRVQQVFRELAPGSLRHALTLVTLLAASDDVSLVREEAMRSARFLDPDLAVQVLAEAMMGESESEVVFAMLDSIEALAGSLPRAQLRPLLELAGSSSDAAVRLRAERIAEAHPA
jgi:hypothetical protein